MTEADRKALFDTSTARIGVDLIEISESSISTLYLCSNTESVTSNGNTYVPAGFRISKPDKGTDSNSGSFEISGVPLDYITIIQELPPSAEITLTSSYVFEDTPNDIVDGPYVFIVEEAQISPGVISLQLAVNSPLDYIISVQKYDSQGCPGIWT
jgi:hypothetical protein